MPQKRVVFMVALIIATGLILFVTLYLWGGKKTGGGVPTSKEAISSRKEKNPSVKASFSSVYNNYIFYKHAENVPAGVKPVLGLNGESYLRRHQALDSLSHALSYEERSALYAYIIWGENDQTAYAIKNDILNEMRNQIKAPSELTEFMIAILEDESQDHVVRMYALQHLRPWYEQYENKDERVIMKKAYYNALQEQNSEFAGIALLALDSLSEDFPDEFDRKTITKAATEIAANHKASNLSRVSALQICSEDAKNESLALMRNIILEKSSDPVLRIAAISALGNIGSASDYELLRNINAGEDGFYQKALLRASASIKSRIEK